MKSPNFSNINCQDTTGCENQSHGYHFLKSETFDKAITRDNELNDL